MLNGHIKLDHEFDLEDHKFGFDIDPEKRGSHLYLIVKVDQPGVFRFKVS